MLLDRVFYHARVQATSGRDSRAVSSDGRLDVPLTTPRALGGNGGHGTNPEQLFAAAYAASFLWALQYIAACDTLTLPLGLWVEGTVGIGPIAQGLGIEGSLCRILPILKRRASFMRAHMICPYSNTTRGNIAVRLVLVSSHA
jgi:Ohr subfamily peroxiredoxin